MAERKPFRLRGLLFVYNIVLAAFSLIGATRALPELAHTLINRGFHYTVCDASVLHNDSRICFWAFSFILSKPIELGTFVEARRTLTF